MKKNETTPKGGNTFLVNMIVSNLKSPCKIQSQSQNREVTMYSQLRIRLLTVLNQLNLPCCVRLEELSNLLDEPIGKTQAGLYSLKRAGLTSYTFLSGAGYVITSVADTDIQKTGCPFNFAECNCDSCLFFGAVCQGSMTLKEAVHDERC